MNIQDVFQKIDRRADLTIEEMRAYATWALETPTHGRGNGEQIRVLREYRRRGLDASDSMIAAAEGEGRGLLASEQRAVDKHVQRAAEIASLIERLEQRDRIDPPGRLPDVARPVDDTPRDWSQRGRTDLTINPTCPVLTSGQRAVDFLATLGRDPIAERFSVGAMILATVTGNRDHLSGAEQRALEAGSGIGGGFAVEGQGAAIIIDRLRPMARVFQAGARTVPMTENVVTLARVDDADAPTWHTENADDITDSNIQFGAVKLTARTLPVIATMSVELAEDMRPDMMAATVEGELLSALSLELDRAALRGTGLQAYPLGLLNRPSVTKTELGTGDGSETVDWDWLLDAIGRVWAANLEPSGYITSSAVAVRTEKYKSAGAGADGQPLNPPRVVANLPRFISNQIPATLTVGSSTDCSEAYIGKWDELLIGMRTNIRMEVSRVSGDSFKKMQVQVRAYLRGDVAVTHGEAFQIVTGLRD
jgi:HK97 family phage major capsid protein